MGVDVFACSGNSDHLIRMPTGIRVFLVGGPKELDMLSAHIGKHRHMGLQLLHLGGGGGGGGVEVNMNMLKVWLFRYSEAFQCSIFCSHRSHHVLMLASTVQASLSQSSMEPLDPIACKSMHKLRCL